MPILNIASYKFITLNDIALLRETLLSFCTAHQLKGTILLSAEGINLNLAGTQENIHLFIHQLHQDTRFADMRFRETWSESQPFKRMKVKLKKEIITLRQEAVQAVAQRAPSISPSELKTWLDEQREMILLDTRNDYEIEMGTFSGAVNLALQDFCQFGDASRQLEKNKPIVMFCTGGIRCEKAALHLMNEGFSEVYQLDGGILNYFEQIGGAHYDGACFVFDERVAVSPGEKVHPKA